MPPEEDLIEKMKNERMAQEIEMDHRMEDNYKESQCTL